MLKLIIFLSILGLNPCLSFSFPCNCHLTKNLVCGTNGKTYDNKCIAKCSGSVSKETIVARFASNNKVIFSQLLVKAPALASLIVPVPNI